MNKNIMITVGVLVVLLILGTIFVLNSEKSNYIGEKTVYLDFGVASPRAECKKICEDTSGKICYENFEICGQKIGVRNLVPGVEYFRENPQVYDEYPCIFFWSRQTVEGNENAPWPCTFKCK